LPEAGALGTKKKFDPLPYETLGRGVAGQEQAPLRWGSEDAGIIGGWSRGGGFLPSMKMQGTCSVFLAFDDPVAESLENSRVDRTVQNIFTFVRDRVLPSFDDLFRR
jgi:hypothetical protein